MQIDTNILTNSLQTILRRPQQCIAECQGEQRKLIFTVLSLFIGLSLLVYGLIIGMFSGGVQLWAAPLKLLSGMLLSTLICLPSFFILSCFSGINVQVREMLVALLVSLCLSCMLLMGFAPIAWVFQQSTESVPFIGSLHLILYLLAIQAGLGILRKTLAQFPESTTRYIRVWTVLFIAVTLQMSCALRPLIGTAETIFPTEKKFFLNHWAEVLNQKTNDTRKNSNNTAYAYPSSPRGTGQEKVQTAY